MLRQNMGESVDQLIKHYPEEQLTTKAVDSILSLASVFNAKADLNSIRENIAESIISMHTLRILFNEEIIDEIVNWKLKRELEAIN